MPRTAGSMAAEPIDGAPVASPADPPVAHLPRGPTVSDLRDLARRAVCQGAPVLLASALALSACGGESEPADEAAPVDCTVAVAETPSEDGPDLSGEPPAELQVEQLAAPPSEDCAEAAAGNFVAVHYTGRSWSTGEVFDSSVGGDPFTFQLGAGRVIPGWDEGIAGLQVGERARLVIPPDMAYGEAGAGAAIGPNETLVFDVQLMQVITPTETATDGQG